MNMPAAVLHPLYFLPEIQFIYASVLIVATVGNYINHCLCHLSTMLFEFGMLLMNHEFECCCCCYAWIIILSRKIPHAYVVLILARVACWLMLLHGHDFLVDAVVHVVGDLNDEHGDEWIMLLLQPALSRFVFMINICFVVDWCLNDDDEYHGCCLNLRICQDFAWMCMCYSCLDMLKMMYTLLQFKTLWTCLENSYEPCC